MPSRLDQLKAELRKAVNPEKATFFPGFFKAPAGYPKDDKFLGVVVPGQRKVAKLFKDLPLDDIEKLLVSEWHEERLTALFIMVGQFQRGAAANKKVIYELYMRCRKHIDNWDLVDSSAGQIVGAWLDDRPEKLEVLQRLASSDIWYERRIAMIATFDYIKKGRADEALVIAEQLLHDKQDLIHKAVGWMLRELGKRVDQSLLAAFLDQHAATMPRTALRYAIEHFTPERRQHYLSLKRTMKS